MESTNLPIKEISCASCGVAIWITSHNEARLRDSGETFYCINGHAQSFQPSNMDKLKKELASANQALSTVRNHAQYLEQELARAKRKPRAKKIKK